jgi:intein-encoded DNA endonuclease-like protein
MRKKGIKIEKIVDLHNQGLSPIEISEKLNCSISNISRRLTKLGVKPLKKNNKNWRRTNRYKVNLNYFDSIDTSEKAYILGLLYADGSVCKDGFYLKMKDEELLLKVKEEMKAEQPVKKYYYGKYWSYILTISSQKLSKELIKQGCFINKTYTLLFPNIDKSLHSHFVRGFFDGDGHLGITDNISTCKVDFTSASTEFLKSLRILISSFSKTNGSLRKENGKSNAWHLRFSGSQVIDVLNWLYKDATIFMRRKHDKFLIYKSVHIKSDKLLENPEEDNQQPIISLND